jgi:hypothetical protein
VTKPKPEFDFQPFKDASEPKNAWRWAAW